MLRGSLPRFLFIAPAIAACTGEISGADPGAGFCEAPQTCFELCLCADGDPVRCKRACGDDISPQPDPTPGAGGYTGSGATSGGGGTAGGGASAGGGGTASGGGNAGGGGGGGTPGAGGGSGPLAASGELARGLAIQSVAIYQGTKVELFSGTTAVSDRNAPVVTGRPALVRVFVKPDPGFTTREIVARVDLGNGPTLDAKRTVSAASGDTSLDSTFNIQVPAARITAGATIAVSLLEAEGSTASGSSNGARAPSSGDAPLGAQSAGAGLEVVLVPIIVGGITPDTSPARQKEYEDHLYKLYPVSDVQISVREPITYGGSVAGTSGGSWNAVLDQLLSVRAADKPESRTYYFGLLTPQQSFSQYCSGGCIAGLSPVAGANDVWARGSIGLGFFPTGGYPGSLDTMAHEIGHAHGLPHAPCGTSNAGPFPYAGGKIGAWGYDLLAQKLIDPDKTKDVMSYCDPTWFSDYNFGKLFARQQHVHAVQNMIVTDPERMPGRYLTLLIDEDGQVSWGQPKDLTSSPLGPKRVVALRDANGNLLGNVSGFDYPTSHHAGSLVLIRESSFSGFRGARSVHPSGAWMTPLPPAQALGSVRK